MERKLETTTKTVERAQRTPVRRPSERERRPSLRLRTDLRAGITAEDDWESPIG